MSGVKSKPEWFWMVLRVIWLACIVLILCLVKEKSGTMKKEKTRKSYMIHFLIDLMHICFYGRNLKDKKNQTSENFPETLALVHLDERENKGRKVWPGTNARNLLLFF